MRVRMKVLHLDLRTKNPHIFFLVKFIEDKYTALVAKETVGIGSAESKIA